MWKDFFYYSKSERRAVFALLVLIALLVVGIAVLPHYHNSVQTIDADDSLVISNLEVGKQRSLVEKDTFDVYEISPRLDFFDPNLADSARLVQLGLSKFVVRNVIKYRQAGGRFPTPESFARIYGLTEEKFEELKPYIRISETFLRKLDKTKRDSAFRRSVERVDTVKRVFKYPVGTLVDVNMADTAELKKIPGIGSVIARLIVDYRNRLGGFYTIEQLSEVKFVTPELLDWFKLEHDSIRKLNINKSSLDRLRAHPYINFYQAKVIVEYRRKRGKIESLSQLSLYEEFTEKDLERLSVYVSFD